MLSDWEGIECDWATNSTSARYYSGKKVKRYRAKYYNEFVQDLVEKRKLTVGIDYYALMYVCKDIIPLQVIQEHGAELSQGKVFVYEVFLQDSTLYWRAK